MVRPADPVEADIYFAAWSRHPLELAQDRAKRESRNHHAIAKDEVHRAGREVEVGDVAILNVDSLGSGPTHQPAREIHPRPVLIDGDHPVEQVRQREAPCRSPCASVQRHTSTSGQPPHSVVIVGEWDIMHFLGVAGAAVEQAGELQYVPAITYFVQIATPRNVGPHSAPHPLEHAGQFRKLVGGRFAKHDGPPLGRWD